VSLPRGGGTLHLHDAEKKTRDQTSEAGRETRFRAGKTAISQEDDERRESLARKKGSGLNFFGDLERIFYLKESVV